MGSSISVPSAVKVGGDLMEAIKGTDLREYLSENEAHGIWGAVQYIRSVIYEGWWGWRRLKGQTYENIYLNMMRMLWEEQYPPCLLWSWVGNKNIKGTVLRECSPKNDAHVVGGAVSTLSVVELGGERGGDEVIALTRHKLQLQGRRREGSETKKV